MPVRADPLVVTRASRVEVAREGGPAVAPAAQVSRQADAVDFRFRPVAERVADNLLRLPAAAAGAVYRSYRDKSSATAS